MPVFSASGINSICDDSDNGWSRSQEVFHSCLACKSGLLARLAAASRSILDASMPTYTWVRQPWTDCCKIVWLILEKVVRQTTFFPCAITENVDGTSLAHLSWRRANSYAMRIVFFLLVRQVWDWLLGGVLVVIFSAETTVLHVLVFLCYSLQ